MGRETLICDTGVVGHLLRRRLEPGRFGHWEQGAVDRIEAGLLAVSIVTIAELRARERTLVTCDRDHVRIAPELRAEVLYLQPPV